MDSYSYSLGTGVSVRSGRDLIDGSTSIQMEYIIAQMVLPSIRSRPDLTDSSVNCQNSVCPFSRQRHFTLCEITGDILTLKDIHLGSCLNNSHGALYKHICLCYMVTLFSNY